MTDFVASGFNPEVYKNSGNLSAVGKTSFENGSH